MSQSNDPTAADTATVAINPTSLQALIQALADAVYNVLVDYKTTTKYSTSIDPYKITSMDVEKKDGKYQWAGVTNMMDY